MRKLMMKGNEAIAESAVRAGCRLYFAYPITPQSEIAEYMSKRLPEVGGTFLQTESEIATVNMVYGAACTGKRVMTSTSSPGFSLMQEGISYIAGAELPCVFVNVVRGGPGLGDIQPAQSDYFQATKGGGHGDYRLIVLAPSTLQEAVDLTQLAFDLADKYRNPVLILADGMIGQMMEPVELPPMKDISSLPDHSSWALTGANGREPHRIAAFNIDPHGLEEMNKRYQEKYARISLEEQRWEEYKTEDAEFLMVGYGTIGRILKSVVDDLREKNLPVGLFRPITLWPFPYKRLEELSKKVNFVLTVEMSSGQMVEDVRLAVNGKAPVYFYGRMGGIVPTPNEIRFAFENLLKEVK
ncbi:3-methyl-2-oxobutanoate dehydrogenase subunit VorB [Thermotoga sp. KOL6]|uniref:3-methyl-2-oxobutanoate dehydrogenase subunit VorB n=1 Tax=Thermotoga sp. KOL6 TaxID=126741 RepID=UPI000CAF5253|nr:3-methyl-2-oxobutanoate dehydrogenase subunit VorB [Thermotoga sp. KOL6]PLV60134.1 2-ketoisovalerate ferredoxin oxidoreductase [Thermotoga sp. KOL6]